MPIITEMGLGPGRWGGEVAPALREAVARASNLDVLIIGPGQRR